MAKKMPALEAEVKFIGEVSGFDNVLLAEGPSAGPTVTEGVNGPSAVFNFARDEAAANNFELASPPALDQDVRYYSDFDGDGAVDGADALIFQGDPDDFTFENLVDAALIAGTGRFTVAFDDGGDFAGGNSGADRDYNDFVASIVLDGALGKANSGRGNGPERGFVDGVVVEIDPGNSMGRNNGGDIL